MAVGEEPDRAAVGRPEGHDTSGSPGEGNRACWRADGRELYYSTPNRELLAVPIEQGPTGLVPGTPRPLFKSTGRFETTAAGDRFLVLQEGR